VLAVIAVGWLVHRGMSAMEQRGWVYYRTKGSGSMGASALFGLNEVFHPSAEHVVVERDEAEQRGARKAAPADPANPEAEGEYDVSDA
jgi:hypothetical protein